jgi:nucleolar protein 9
MPKEHQKRGRREVEKRKRQEEEQEHYRNPATSPKRLKPEMELDRDDVEIKLDDERPPRSDREMVDPDEPSPWPAQLSGGHGGADNPTAPPFYGTLDEGEQAYFKQADNILEVNQFPNDDERALFVANVYREAAGKELKVANSQSCSRFLERLIRMSTASQLKGLFQKLQGQ